MKRFLWIGVLALGLPMAAVAVRPVYFGNTGGTLSGSSVGMQLTGSALANINGLNPLHGLGQLVGNLGTISVSTAALTSGSLQTGGTFANGGSFTITGNGTGGIPNGTIFAGGFHGPVTWTMVTLANGTHSYLLSGSLAGTWYDGSKGSGATVQMTVNTGTTEFNGSATLASGQASLSAPTSESGELGLLGVGLIGIAAFLQFKPRSA